MKSQYLYVEEEEILIIQFTDGSKYIIQALELKNILQEGGFKEKAKVIKLHNPESGDVH